MSKISAAFLGKKAFIAYLMAGDPNLERTREYILALEKAGADLIEIGIPFSDPLAEGEVIQRANLRAFSSGTNLPKIFEMVASLKGVVKIPLLFMTYINPVFNYGYAQFFSKCSQIGISGIIVPDMPYEEQGEIRPASREHGIDVITLVAPTSDHRVETIAKAAEGFIYLVSSLGVTGVRSEITTDISAIVARIRQHTHVSVAVGFGISSPEQAQTIAQHADGVIVGSAIVRIIEEHGEQASTALTQYVEQMKAAMMC